MTVWQTLAETQTPSVRNLTLLINAIRIEPTPLETAQINLQRGVVTIDPGFLLKHLHTELDLAFIVLHEREHCLIRYLLDGEDPSLLLCFIQDAYINNHLNTLLKSDLPERYYQDNPICLPLTRKHEELRYFLMYLQIPVANQVADFLQTISQKTSTDYQKWKAVFGPVAEELLKRNDSRLPGNFGQGTPDTKESKRDTLAGHNKKQQEPDKKAVPTQKEGLLRGKNTQPVHLVEPSDYRISEEVFRKLKDVGNTTQPGRLETPVRSESLSSLKTFLVATSTEKIYKAKSVIPPSRPSNTDLMLLSAGYVPADFDVELTRSGKKWCLFLDTSGSMLDYYGLILAFARQLHPFMERMYQFASLVCPMDYRKECWIKVSGGTDFEAVSKIIVKEDLKNIIVVSDNNATISLSTKKMLKKTVQTLIFVPVPHAQPTGAWFDVADKIFKL
jgi:hypothetical protein